jgi:uncharacterized protein (DUF58 family)
VNALREALLRGRRRPRNAGAGSPTLYRGDGYEFVELREYVPGDDIRRIDWAATARCGELQTRIVLEDVALTIAAILDTSASMQAGRERALAQSAQEILDLWFGAASSGDRCFRVLARDIVEPWAATADAPFSLSAALEAAAVALRRGAALLVISDFFDLPQDDELLVLLGRRFDCTALIARDPWHEQLPLSGLVQVADSENARTARLFIGAAERERYKRAVRERESKLVQRLGDANWRVEVFDEKDGGAALLRAFAVR